MLAGCVAQSRKYVGAIGGRFVPYSPSLGTYRRPVPDNGVIRDDMGQRLVWENWSEWARKGECPLAHNPNEIYPLLR